MSFNPEYFFPTIITNIVNLNGGLFGTVKGTDVYPAVDVTDVTQSPTGTTKPYQILELINFIYESLGFEVYQPVLAVTTTNLTATYNNGLAGVGATLTNSGVQAAFITDGQTGVLNGRYIVAGQTSQLQNGIYVLTNTGSATTDWILTRSIDFNQPSNITDGGLAYVIYGSLYANTYWQVTFTSPVTVGTTSIIWTEWDFISTELLDTIEADSGSATPTDGKITISGGATGLTTSASGSTVDLTGILDIANGGTSVSSVTSTPSASAWAGWDANTNFSSNNFISAYTTTVTSATTTTLVVGSTYAQFFTGSTTQTVIMPVTSTLKQGQPYYIVNNSTGAVTVKSSGGNTIITMAANTAALMTCILTSGTTAASWYAEYEQSSLSLPLSLANGGTGQSLSAVDSAVMSTTAGGAVQLSTTLPSGLSSTNMTLVTPTLGAATATSLAFSPTTGGIIGTTAGDNAGAGYVGQFISSVIASGSAISLTSTMPANVTSISLTDGDWDVWGNINVSTSLADLLSIFVWSSETSSTTPDPSLYNLVSTSTGILGSNGLSIPALRYNVSSPATVYLSTVASFASGTVTACGGIYARRVR